ncbi:MAG: allantoicase [Acidimicrobiia bacterium]
MVDLATSRVGGEVIWCNDEFFAPVANLISPTVPVWKEGNFTDHGKWMDGWETRRRRDEGHDACVLRLGLPGIVRTVTVDTSFFTGNFPESFTLEACGVPTERLDEAEWVEIIPRTTLSGDNRAEFAIADTHRVTHLRLNIFPDGGIARLRVDGDPIPDMRQVCPDDGPVDLASATVGGRGVEASDSHYSSPANLVSPTEPEGMWDGWETARRRGPGHDWAVVELGLPGIIQAVDVDTRHFKGNSPGWVVLDVALGGKEWSEVCERVPVQAHAVNHVDLPERIEADRVRLNIHPDGGVARLRVWGFPQPAAAAAVRMSYLNSLFPQAAHSFFATACAASPWVDRMVASRPYPDAATVLAAADNAFERLDEDGWRQAFAAHPRIGERQGGQNRAGEELSAGEQAGVATADDAIRAQIADINRRYEDRFGHTYIVRAAGRTAEEMLAIATRRLDNDPGAELKEAAGEQRQITTGRLRRMLCLPEEDA